MYRAGTRIVTLSRRKPLHIIYKPIGSLHIQLLDDAGADAEQDCSPC